MVRICSPDLRRSRRARRLKPSVAATSAWAVLLVLAAAGPLAAQPPALPPSPPGAMSGDATELLARLHEQLQSARQRLQQSETGAPTRTAQRGAVSLLDQLIAAAERDEAEKTGGASAAEASGAPRPQAAPAPAAEKPDAGPQSESRPRRPDNGPPGAWGRLRERQRDEIFGAVPGRPLPPRYRALVDQYFESFQHGRR